MYERFTERSRRIMQNANQAAQRLGHDRIDVEHVLLGILETPDCVAAQVLIRLGVDPHKLRLELERLAPAKAANVTARLPQTRSAKRVIELAMTESRSLDSGYVGSEHLLLGLVGEGQGIAAQILTTLRVTPADVVAEIPHVLSRGTIGQNRLW